MNPSQPQHGNHNSPSSGSRNNQRRRPGLSIPLPLRDPSLAVPLPLPPIIPRPHMNFSDLERDTYLGSGRGGTVFRVIHRPTKKIFALKVIFGTHEDGVRTQIHREIQILRDVDHPNIVKCHEMFEIECKIQVLLEYMDKGSLKGAQIVDEIVLANVALQILKGLEYLHRKKIVHRDIKPGNLLWNEEGEVKIADFGVSRILSKTMDPCNSSVGTIAYMSPERINTDSNDGQYDGYAGDVWSFGICILELKMGKFPFNIARDADWATLVCAICMSPPPSAPTSCSREFRDFIDCCLRKDPRERWSVGNLLKHPYVALYGDAMSVGGGGGGGSKSSQGRYGSSSSSGY